MAAGILPGMGTTDARPRPFLTVEAKSVHGDFEEAKHPRDRHGRFISIGAHIDLGGGKKGEVTHVGAGSVTVKQDNGTSVTVKGDAIKNATVTKGPADGARAAAEAHAPDHASAPDHSPTDRSATPGTPDAKTGTDAVAALEDSVKRDLTPDERGALMDYVGGGYRKLNRALRGGDALSGDQQQTADTLQRLGDEHALHEPVVLYRGIDRDATVAFGDIGTAQGTEFTDRGFGSTTLQADRASSWAGTLAQSRRNDSAVLQIHAPRGTPALPVEQLREGRSGIEHLRSRDRSTSGQFGSEEEVVLMPGARLRVTSDSEQDGHRVIVAEVVPNGSTASVSASKGDGPTVDPAIYGQGSYAKVTINGKAGDARPGGPTEPSIVGLDRNQNRAVDQYQADSITQALNGALRRGEEPTGKVGYWDPAKMGGELVPLLDSAINAGTITDDTTLWRGVQLTPEQAAQYVPGAVVQDLGYWSSSFSEDVADYFIDYRKRDGASGFKFKMLAPAGTHATKGTEDLNELILARGSRVRVVGVADNVITVEVLP